MRKGKGERERVSVRRERQGSMRAERKGASEGRERNRAEGACRGREVEVREQARERKMEGKNSFEIKKC